MAVETGYLERERSLKRAIVLDLLQEPTAQRDGNALALALQEPDRAHLRHALEGLREDGLIEHCCGLISISRPALALDELNLLGI